MQNNTFAQPNRFWLQRFWPRHFAQQVILLTSLTLIVSTVLLTSYQIAEVSKFQYDNSQVMLDSIAENISLGITPPLIVRDYAEIENLLIRAASFPGIRSISLVGANGRIISSVQHEPGKPVEPVFSGSKLTPPPLNSTYFTWTYGKSKQANPLALGLDATALSLWHPIEKGGLGWLHINISVEKVRDDALQLIQDSIIFALAGLLVLMFVLSRLLKPTLRAFAEATAFAKGLRYMQGQQTWLYNGNIEVEQLAHALNDTSARLYAQKVEIIDSKNLLSNVLDAASEVSIIAADTQGIITVFNRGAELMLGYSAAETISKMTPASFHLPEEVQKRAQELSDILAYPVSGFRTFVELAEQQGSEQREWTFVRKNGEQVAISLVVTTMRNDKGEITGYLGIAQDITERKRNDKMKNEFVSTVSHELRTPLTAIAGALGLIAGGALGEMPGTAKQMLDIAYKNSQRLSFLINDLLDMEKLVAGKMHFDLKQQPLLPLIEQSLDGNRTYGAARRVTLRLDCAVPDVEVYVDHQRLLQVMSNLLSNAIKYSPEDDTVEISVQPHEHSVRITVSDHGPGIPVQFHNRIFGKFSQADSSDTREKGGTGLGLFITRELVERMGGKIGFDSAENQGASFYVDLPISGTQHTNTDTTLLAADKNAPRILIVEDEPDIAKLISIMLNRAGYTVDIAFNGTQALQALKQASYVAMTLDLLLPDISGLELIQRIRNQPETKVLPILVISVKMEEGRLAINGDFSDIEWLAKPIDEAHLLSAVEKRLPEQSTHRCRVLHVEDDADLHQVILAMSGERFDFAHASSLREARSFLRKENFDLVILDISLPDGSGWHLLPEIRLLQSRCRVIILSGENTTPDEARKVEAVLLKSNISPKDLLLALNGNMQPQLPITK